MIRFDVVTLFPEMFAAVSESGITRRALENGLWRLALWNPRDFTADNHRTVDERPYGGGPGMVMLAAPLEQAIVAAREAQRAEGLSSGRVILLSPQGANNQAGSATALTLTVTNNDSAGCPAGTFALASSEPANWLHAFAPGVLSIAPGASATSTLTETTPILAPAGSSMVTGTATSATARNALGSLRTRG